MLQVLGSGKKDTGEAPETAMLQKFIDFIKLKNYTLDNFLGDIDDTPLSELISPEVRNHLKMVGLKTIISRYCSPKRSFTSELFLNEMTTMGISVIFAARFDSTLTTMRMAFAEANVTNDDDDEDNGVNVVKDIFGRDNAVEDASHTTSQ